MRHGMALRILVSGLLLGLSLSGCSSVRQAVGLGKNPPDEFQVVSHPPLAMPANYDLPTPDPGEARPQEATTTVTAQTLLLANATAPAGATPAVDTATDGEKALLAQAGAENSDPKIRAVVDAEAEKDAAQGHTVMEYLAFWRPAPLPGTVVDPEAEQQRIQQDAALGKPLSAGGPTPTVSRKPMAPLEGIF